MKLKKQSLDCLCSVLKSLVIWSGKGSQQDRNETNQGVCGNGHPGLGLGIVEGSSPRESTDTRGGDPNESLMSPSSSMPLETINISTPTIGTPDPSGGNTPTSSSAPGGGLGLTGEDDPLRFENAKQRKTSLIEGIRKFNVKPKRGIAFLIENGFIRRPPPIPSEDPTLLLPFRIRNQERSQGSYFIMDPLLMEADSTKLRLENTWVKERLRTSLSCTLLWT